MGVAASTVTTGDLDEGAVVARVRRAVFLLSSTIFVVVSAIASATFAGA